jgi:mannose-1-phosphate guanylyltransferase
VLDALAKHEPAMAEHLATIGRAIGSGDYPATLDREFAAIGGKSIDYAVLEKHDDVAVVAAPFAWDDVGSWQALARLRGADAAGNTVLARHIGIETRGTLVRGPADHLIVTVGVEDLIVVHTPDATLVAHRGQEEALRKVVEQLKTQGWSEYL